MARTATQLLSLLRGAARELLFGLRATSAEVRHWRALARSQADAELRKDALVAIARKRGNIHGAALFWTLPDTRSRPLLRTLVAWEMLADYLDCVSERQATLGIEHGRELHRPLIEALRPARGLVQSAERVPDAGAYASASGTNVIDSLRCREGHLGSGDDTYVRMLVKGCQAGCAELPSYDELAPLTLKAARLALVLAVNHEPDALTRDATLQRWATENLPHRELLWFERTAGASAWLTVLAMLSLAARPASDAAAAFLHARKREAKQTYLAYLHSVSLVGAMLDSYGDIAEDAEGGEHSYIGHYAGREAAVERVATLMRRSRADAKALPNGHRHSLLLGCMIAFYLSKDSVRTPQMRKDTSTLLTAGGPLVRLLLPVLRVWRVAYKQSAA